MQNYLFLLFSLLIFINCSRPDPKPELKDFIYQDYIEQKGLIEKSLTEIEAQINEHNKSMTEAIPQTGQLKWSQKRLFEAESNRDKLKQQIKYFEIKINQRAKYVRKENYKSFNTGKIFDNLKEVEEYKAEKKLRSAKYTWDHKKRLEEAKNVENNPSKKGQE